MKLLKRTQINIIVFQVLIFLMEKRRNKKV